MRLNTKAFAIAGGGVAGGAVFCLTLLSLLTPGPRVAPPFLGGWLFGYTLSVAGAFIGAMWSYVYGFLMSAAFAFVYNLAAASSAPPVE